MLKKNQPRLSRQINEIKLFSNPTNSRNIYDNINQQTHQTNKHDYNLLQKIHADIFLLTVKKPITDLKLKKLSTEAQYALLPELHEEKPFYKISFSSLKNQCHIYGENSQVSQIDATSVELIFYFQLSLVEDALAQALKGTNFVVREILTNKTIIITDGIFNYPLIISKVPSLTIWQGLKSMDVAFKKELESLEKKARLMAELFQALKTVYQVDWQLKDGQMSYCQNGKRKPFDYISVLDDMIYVGHQNRSEEYLKNFNLSDLDSSSFPTVSIRSMVHLKARPSCLSQVENGYAIVASRECAGNQTVIENLSQKSFPLWLKRSFRHIPRHRYQARVIFSEDKSVFSLVGEQISSIALFPALVKGVFESLDIDAPKSVRLVAHSEDVLTIAKDESSWMDINATNKKASSLFRMICHDGADPLSLFEQILLPKVGLGQFKLQIVPEQFFELTHVAKSLKYSIPAGHDHYLLGLAFQCVREWGLALLEFQKALRFDAQDPEILHAYGCALMELGQGLDAAPFLKKAFELLPEDPEVANNFGRSNLECGEIGEAISAFERAVRLSPGSADYLKNLGDGYWLAARPHEAMDSLQKALRCDPYFAEAHASLAHLHLEIGDHSQAEKHALLAYKENPSDANIASLLWQLTVSKKP